MNDLLTVAAMLLAGLLGDQILRRKDAEADAALWHRRCLGAQMSSQRLWSSLGRCRN